MNQQTNNQNSNPKESKHFNKPIFKAYNIISTGPDYFLSYVSQFSNILVKRPRYCRELKFSYQKEKVNIRLLQALKYLKYCKKINDLEHFTGECNLSKKYFKTKLSHLLKFSPATNGNIQELLTHSNKISKLFPYVIDHSYNFLLKDYMYYKKDKVSKLKNWPKATIFNLTFDGGKVMLRDSNRIIRFLVENKCAQFIKINLKQNLSVQNLQFSPNNLLLAHCTKIDMISQSIINRLDKWKALQKISFKEVQPGQFSKYLDFSKATNQLHTLEMTFLIKKFSYEQFERIFKIRFPPKLKSLKVTANCTKETSTNNVDEGDVNQNIYELIKSFKQHVSTLNNLEELIFRLNGFSAKEKTLKLWAEYFYTLQSSCSSTLKQLIVENYTRKAELRLDFESQSNLPLEYIKIDKIEQQNGILQNLSYINQATLKVVKLYFDIDINFEEILQGMEHFPNLQYIYLDSSSYLKFKSLDTIYNCVSLFKKLEKIKSYTISLLESKNETETEQFIIQLKNFYQKALKLGCTCTFRFNQDYHPYRQIACGPNF